MALERMVYSILMFHIGRELRVRILIKQEFLYLNSYSARESMILYGTALPFVGSLVIEKMFKHISWERNHSVKTIPFHSFMVDVDLLHCIYHFDGIDLPSNQGVETCWKLCELFASFAEDMVQSGRDNLSGCTSTHYKNLKDFLQPAKGTLEAPHIEWFPGYGCVIIIHKHLVQRQSSLNVTVLGLDAHVHVVHSGQDQYEFSSIAQTYAELHVGELVLSKKQKFLETFHILFKTASSRKGNERSAGGDRQGHQKTPAFIQAILIQALCDTKSTTENEDVLPRGGFTDVGQHTGGKARDTVFALVRSVCEWTMKRSFIQNSEFLCNELAYDAVMLHFHSFVLEDAIQAIENVLQNESSNLSLKSVSHLWSIMKVVCVTAARLSDHGHDLSVHYSKMKLAKAVIKKAQHQWHQNCSIQNTIELPRVSYRVPIVLVPSIVTFPTSGQATLADIKLLVKENIELIPTFPLDKDWTVSSAHEWANQLKSKSFSSSSTLSVYLHHIEQMFWRLSENHLVEPLDFLNLKKVADLLDIYRESVNHSFSQKSEARHVSSLHVRMRSIELLAAWLVYCIAFTATRASYPDVLEGYGVALRFQDLSHLVLQDEKHIVVLKRVVAFLGENHLGDEKEIFSMRSPQNWNSATFDMGRRYSKLFLSSTLEKEKEDAKHRVTSHWQEVQRKQDLASRLRIELSDLNHMFTRASNEYDVANRMNVLYEYQHQYQNTVNRTREKMNSAKSSVDVKKQEIENAEKAPPPVIQPLPSNDDKALVVLFFLYMSREFKILSRLSLVAQQLLVPKPWVSYCGGQDGIQKVDVAPFIAVKLKEVSWSQHYNDYQKCSYHTPRNHRTSDSQWLDISMHGEVPDKKDIGPRHVDNYSSRGDGIWYPDKNNVRLMWHGGSLNHDKLGIREEFNPFAIPPSFTAAYFTERLPKDSQELQQSLYLPPNVFDDMCRGNRSYSSLNLRKDWLDKEGFLHFNSLRQFPSQVLHKLAVALKSECLPLHEESVQILFRQAAFQIGTLRLLEERIDFMCRRDFEEIRTTCLLLIAELVEKYAETPSFYQAFVILAELACYFSSVFAADDGREVESNKSVVEILGSAAMKWALSCDSEIDHDSPECVSSIRARQVVYFRTAALCLVHKNDLSLSEATILLTCVIRAKNVYVEDNDALEERENLNLLCIHFLSDNSSYRSILMVSLKTLSEVLKCIVVTAPASLEWIQDDTSNYCFSAIGSDNHVYAMNILSGIVLIDGMPLNTLPSSITNDKRYKRVFGKINFEVVLKGEKLETVQPVKGHLYRFQKSSSYLHIEESVRIDEDADIDGYWEDPLELLDIFQIATWGGELPKKLKDTYSHWISRKRNIVFFRSKEFCIRNCAYMHDMTVCKRQNAFDQNNVFDGMVSHRLVIHDSPILAILERMETRDMIHTFLLPSDSILFELYRFGLSFSLESDSTVFCLEIVGYQLAPIQHLQGMFAGLQNYLILEKSNDTTLKKVIVPFGNIIRDIDSNVRISLVAKDLSPSCNNVNEEIQFFQYDIHPRFKSLDSPSISARLFLAALFAATMSNVPDFALKMTGEEQACILVRQCQGNTPHSPIEMKCLENLMTLSRGKSPALSLLCHDMKRSAREFYFLHHPSNNDSMKAYKIDEGMFSLDTHAYLKIDDTVSSTRVLLTSGESQRITGTVNLQSRMKTKRRDVNFLEVDDCPISREDIASFNASISKLWTEESCQPSKDQREFPVSCSANTDLEEIVYRELKESWKLHCQESITLVNPAENSITSIDGIKKSVALALSTVEKYIFDVLAHQNPTENHWHAGALSYLRLINVIPTATKLEIVALACNSSKVTEYNPLLSQTSIGRTRQAVIIWLELCVLQDKLSFLLNLGHDKNKDFMRELTSQRTWETSIHPYWLVYEVEQGIRIRPEQYEVANHLINNNGQVVQLNMGLGKTRVILPMLILYYSYQPSCERIPRLHILSTLISEVCDHFHTTLGASVLTGRLFTLPFRRDAELDIQKVQSILDVVSYCRRERGFFVVAPEHRLSLELKVKELHLNGQQEMSKALGQVVSSCWHDIYDEVDEILHHRYQLVYSIGSVKPLPQMIHRWKAAQALLKLLRSKACQVKSIVIVINNKELEAFPWITIEDDVDSKDFKRKMAESLFDQPPMAFAWLANHSKRKEMIKVVSEASANPMYLENKLSHDHFIDVLAFRGLLAHDVLLHCLKKKYRVDFGPNHLESRKKLAVPYRGADTPSKRSEFSHPDCAMLLSILTYYSSGLSKNDLRATFSALLRKGRNFKKTTYNIWFAESCIRMNKTTYNAINKIEKIDLTNKSQFDVLYEYFRKNPETINFWLNTIIFPRYLDCYPQRLVATAWHLASNRDNCSIGFSGTNDNHLVLPLQLKQYLPWGTDNSIWRNLLSTNGKMLDLVIQKTISCKELGDGRANELLLKFITSNKNIDALIDCGALLAGISNRHVADYLAEQLLPYSISNLRGITFYDDSTKEWMILEQSGRCLSKNQSSLKEKDTFALFDEPRCRGVDMKLRPNAVAILTLGQGMCKDKFMQAAGRMRQLHNEQSLIIVGERIIFNAVRQQSFRAHEGDKVHGQAQERGISTDDLLKCIALGAVTDEVLHPVTALQILKWVIQNTVQSIVRGIGTWSDQGIFFATESEPRHGVLDDKSDLQSFYGKPIQNSPLSKVAISSIAYHFERTRYSEGYESLPHVQDIVERCEKIGNGYFVVRSAADEECEREMQREIEEEDEEEIEIEKLPPRNEEDWNYSSIFSIEGPSLLPTETYCFVDALSKFWSDKEGLRRIKWSNNLFCTRNFIETISDQGRALDEYLRIPDCLVRFQDGKVLLLSDREGAKICELFLERQLSEVPCTSLLFGHFAFETDPSSKSFLRCNLTTHVKSLSDIDSCSIKLFNGETVYPSSQRTVMKDMLCLGISENSVNSNVSGSPEKFVVARQKQKDLELSHLQELCNELICELEQLDSQSG